MMVFICLGVAPRCHKMSLIFETLGNTTGDITGSSGFTSGAWENKSDSLSIGEFSYSYLKVHASGAWAQSSYLQDVSVLNVSSSISFIQSWKVLNQTDLPVIKLPVSSSISFIQSWKTSNQTDSPSVSTFNVNKNVISNDNINSLESTSIVPWNAYPGAIVEPDKVLSTRDETRFKRTSSFSRRRPVRIRLFRK